MPEKRGHGLPRLENIVMALSPHCLRLAVLYGCQARGWAYLHTGSVNLMRRGRVEEEEEEIRGGVGHQNPPGKF